DYYCNSWDSSGIHYIF
nr:immunoglobulin light chain junction region [Macaca mulatta]